MMFEAILFLSGAVLFFLAVLFFVFLWQDRTALVRRKAEMQANVEALERQAILLKEQRVDIDIWEHELTVWAEGLERQQLAIEQAQEQLRMLTASKVPPANGRRQSAVPEDGEVVLVKNIKRQRDGVKLPK